MSDPTEALRRVRIEELNQGDTTRAELEEQYGQVWSTDEMTKDFDALGFMAPYIVVSRKSDGVRGSLEFRHSPRYYFNFQAE
jgi:hypothetical protein